MPIHRSCVPTVSVDGVEKRLVWWRRADPSKGEVHPRELPDGAYRVTSEGEEHRIKVRKGALSQECVATRKVARALDAAGVVSLAQLERVLESESGRVRLSGVLSTAQLDYLRRRLEHRAKLRSGVKVIVGGPPHSGKSVFIEGLKQSLPGDDTFLFSACPDGEGPWLQKYYNDPNVVRLRKKGKFSEDFVQRSREVVQSWVGPLMLVDVGGITSSENAEIVQGATHAIILSGDPAAVAEWEAFFAASGLDVVATLHSDYHGDRDAFVIDGDHVTGSVHYLERGEHSAERETVLAVADVLTGIVRDNFDFVSPVLQDDRVVQVRDVLNELPGHEVERTLPSGVTVTNRVLERRALPALYERIAEQQVSGAVMLDGPVNGWEAIALMSAYRAGGCDDISMRGPDGFVSLVQLPQGSSGDTVDWNVTTTEVDGSVVVVVHADVSASTRRLDPLDLSTMTIPAVPDGSTVVISTQGPHWFRASVALGYQQNCSAVASFVPGEGATVAWSQDPQRLGDQLWVTI